MAAPATGNQGSASNAASLDAAGADSSAKSGSALALHMHNVARGFALLGMRLVVFGGWYATVITGLLLAFGWSRWLLLAALVLQPALLMVQAYLGIVWLRLVR